MHATAVALYRLRGGVEELLFELRPYCGYGACQHFHNLRDHATYAAGAPLPTLRAGDELEFRCVYDNPDPYALGYGLSAMTEMCGPILIYTPHDVSQPPRRTWHDSDRGRYRAAEGGRGPHEWQRMAFKGHNRDDTPHNHRA